MSKGLFLSVEGLDGSGKGSNIRAIMDLLALRNIPAFLASEYDDKAFCNPVRMMTRDNSLGLSGAVESMLQFASRLYFTEHYIKPALEQGKLVVADRYYHTTLAFQGATDPHATELVYQASKPHMVEPDLVLYYDVPVDTFRSRVLARDGKFDRYEAKPDEFHNAVRSNFLRMMESDTRFVLIDASRPLDEVVDSTLSQVSKFLQEFPCYSRSA